MAKSDADIKAGRVIPHSESCQNVPRKKREEKKNGEAPGRLDPYCLGIVFEELPDRNREEILETLPALFIFFPHMYPCKKQGGRRFRRHRLV